MSLVFRSGETDIGTISVLIIQWELGSFDRLMAEVGNDHNGFSHKSFAEIGVLPAPFYWEVFVLLFQFLLFY
jgi:hypothetical protein